MALTTCDTCIKRTEVISPRTCCSHLRNCTRDVPMADGTLLTQYGSRNEDQLVKCMIDYTPQLVKCCLLSTDDELVLFTVALLWNMISVPLWPPNPKGRESAMTA